MSAALSLFELDAPVATQPEHNHRIAADVLAVLRSLDLPIARSGEITIDLPLMDAGMYANVAVVLNACNIHWHRRRKTHLATAVALAELQCAIASGSYYDSKRALEFYATSEATADILAAELAEHVDWLDQPQILEPSAGDGALVQAVLNAIPQACITAIELDPRRAALLRHRFLGDPRVRVVESDVLRFEEREWDGVITNPPFEHSLAHIEHVAKIARVHAPVVGIAMTTRKKDEAVARFLHERDALTWDTDGDAFVGTTVTASCFVFRTSPSLLDRLREVIAREHPSIGLPAIQTLCELSRDLHLLFTDHCNGDIQSNAYDVRCAELLGRANRLVSHEHITIKPAWDPRAGHGMCLRLPSGYTNDFGQNGVIVPCALAIPTR